MMNKLVLAAFAGVFFGFAQSNSANEQDDRIAEPFIEAGFSEKISSIDASSSKLGNGDNVFQVTKGTLKSNALRLSSELGLTVYDWKARDYRIEIPYSFKYDTVDNAYRSLLHGYPVQAVIIDNDVDEQVSITFSSRRVASEDEQ